MTRKQLINKTEFTKYSNDMNTVIFEHFNVRELDLFFAICSKLKFKRDSKVTLTFKTLKELANITTVSKKEMVELLDSTYDKMLNLKMKVGNEDIYSRFVLFQDYTVNNIDETITISVGEKFQYVLNNLSSNFTRFQTTEFTSLKSMYSKEVYRFLKQFRRTGQWFIKIDEFRACLRIPESYTMSDIDKRVLKKVEKELKPIFKGLSITKIRPKKNGRVERLEFRFEKETDPKKIEQEYTPEEIEDSVDFVKSGRTKQEEILETLYSLDMSRATLEEKCMWTKKMRALTGATED